MKTVTPSGSQTRIPATKYLRNRFIVIQSESFLADARFAFAGLLPFEALFGLLSPELPALLVLFEVSTSLVDRFR